MENDKKWYQKTWVIIVLLVLFFPAGLYLMWKYSNWNKVTKWIITGLFIIAMIASSSGNKNKSNNISAPTPTSKKIISYEIFKRSSIPNGGEAKVVIISPDLFNETDMPLLGEKLRNDVRNDKNAFIFVFTDRKSAEMRDLLMSLSDVDLDYYDKHYVGQYNKNGNSNYNEFVIYFDGVNGTNSKTIKY